MAKKRLGEVLRERKHISVEDLDRALLEQQNTARLMGELLLERELVSKDDLVSALEEAARLRYVDVRFATVEKAALELGGNHSSSGSEHSRICHCASLTAVIAQRLVRKLCSCSRGERSRRGSLLLERRQSGYSICRHIAGRPSRNRARTRANQGSLAAWL
jgi:hypothetical protein